MCVRACVRGCVCVSVCVCVAMGEDENHEKVGAETHKYTARKAAPAHQKSCGLTSRLKDMGKRNSQLESKPLFVVLVLDPPGFSSF